MQTGTSLFSDPTQRAGLESYYENMKTDLIDSLKAREADPAFQSSFTAKIQMPDGTSKEVTANLITAEMAEKSLVPFDVWVDIMQQTHDSQTRMFEMAQKRLDMLTAESPDSSSHVRTTFSANGQLLAYINADGTLVTSNIGPKHGDTTTVHTQLELKLHSIVEQANAMNLSGQRRIDYLNKAVKNTLSQEFNNLNTTTYDSTTSPTKRAFSQMWHKNFNIDQVYNDALADAQASYNDAKAWHDQMQSNLDKINAYLLSLQEVA